MLLSDVKIKDLNPIRVPIHQTLCTINYFYSCNNKKGDGSIL